MGLKSTIKKIQHKYFVAGSIILFLTTLGSYLTGLVRDRIFAHTFGISRELDIYNTAFIIPDLLLTIFVSSALSPAFIPMFTSLVSEEKRAEANRLGSTIIISAITIVVVLGSIAALLMPAIAPRIAPGFSVAEQAQLITYTRLLMISPIFIALSSALGGMLISYKNFIAYGVSPILYNIGIVIGALTAGYLGILGLILGTLLGAVLHVVPRLLMMRKMPFRFSWNIDFKDANFTKVLKLMLPKMIGHPVEQMKFFGFTRIATLLATGSVSAVSFARNFQSVPVSLFGIAVSVAAFPILSSYAALNNFSGFRATLFKALRSIIVWTVPAAVGLYLLSDLPIRILLGGGKFSDEGIFRTAQTLSIFALSIPTESLIHLLARSFYALKNTLIPVLMSVVGLTISITFATLKYPTSDILAIPYGFFLGSSVEVVLLGLLLYYRIKRLFS